MKIAKVEIEVIKMTNEELNQLWKDWKQHYIDKKKIFICEHEMLDWDTNDGQSYILLDRDGTKQWLSTSKIENER